MNVSNQREPDTLLLPIEKMKGWRLQLCEAVFDFEVLPKSETSHAAYPPCTSLGRIRSFWLPTTIRVELNPETEARLKAQARAKGLPLEKVAEQLLKEALTGRSLPQGQMSVEEFHRMLDAMAEGSERLPDLPTESFSRASFYEDRLDGRDAVPRR